MTHHYDVHAYIAQPPTLGDIYKVRCKHSSYYAKKSELPSCLSAVEPAQGPQSELGKQHKAVCSLKHSK